MVELVYGISKAVTFRQTDGKLLLKKLGRLRKTVEHLAHMGCASAFDI